MKVVVSIDQLFRPNPGGIASYVRGLIQGLGELDGDVRVTALAPRGDVEVDLEVDVARAWLPVSALTRAWARSGLGVPREADVVHATTLAGPFRGGRSSAVRSVAVHDLLWRDQPGATTPRGIRFHESRLRHVIRDESLRVFTTSPGLETRLVRLGVAAERVRAVRLGVDDAVRAASPSEVTVLLDARGVRGPYSLYVGTREPRKNLERLVRAHELALQRGAPVGTLVLVGPSGWGEVDTGRSVVIEPQARAMLKGLIRDATLCAYVPLAEGFGLPPVEALFAGTRVVVSDNVPSVSESDAVVHVDPLEVESIAAGLERACDLEDDEAARAARRASVAEYTWANCARDHIEGWS